MEPTIYLFFNGNCLEAMTHYAETIGGEIGGVFRNADAPDEAPGGMVVAERPQLPPLRLCAPLWPDRLFLALDSRSQAISLPHYLLAPSRENLRRAQLGLHPAQPGLVALANPVAFRPSPRVSTGTTKLSRFPPR
jgi:hypothetical protein